MHRRLWGKKHSENASASADENKATVCETHALVKGKGKRSDILFAGYFLSGVAVSPRKLVLQSTWGREGCRDPRDVCENARPKTRDASLSVDGRERNGTIKWLVRGARSYEDNLSAIIRIRAAKANDSSAVVSCTLKMLRRCSETPKHGYTLPRSDSARRGTESETPSKKAECDAKILILSSSSSLARTGHPFAVVCVYELNGARRAKTFRRNWDTFLRLSWNATDPRDGILPWCPYVFLYTRVSARIFISLFPLVGIKNYPTASKSTLVSFKNPKDFYLREMFKNIPINKARALSDNVITCSR